MALCSVSYDVVLFTLMISVALLSSLKLEELPPCQIFSIASSLYYQLPSTLEAVSSTRKQTTRHAVLKGNSLRCCLS
jgi:hypothetical protein